MTTKFAAFVTGLAMAVTLFTPGSATANTNARASVRTEMQAPRTVVTPLAMQYFCAKHRSECASSRRTQVTMSAELLTSLKQVTVQVNRAIRPKRDAADSWDLNPSSGDCEDYVLSKRSALIRSGVTPGALRIAYTHTGWGEPHAVLVVKTSEGDLVLDNLNNAVKSLRSTGYSIRSMSGANPLRWTAG